MENEGSQRQLTTTPVRIRLKVPYQSGKSIGIYWLDTNR